MDLLHKLVGRILPYSNISYSQEGEDLVLKRIFENKQKGFYVDVGAHHPKRFSNTYAFYLMGWRGINIDAMPGSMKLFNKYRPNDVNIEKPISDSKGKLDYYIFDEPALNGFSKQISEDRNQNTNYKIQQVIEIESDTLESILDNYLPKNTVIDFMSIDVEGLDFNVLQSANIEKYKPCFILIEILNSENEEITNYLNKFGYKFFAKTLNTQFFKYIL